MSNENDVVVTGLGLVSPIGIGMADFTESLRHQKSGIKTRELFAETNWPFRIGGIVDDYDPKKFVKPRKSLKLMCREIQFGFGAAQMAFEDSGIDFEAMDSTRVGVVCGSDTFYCDPTSTIDSYSNNGETVRDVSVWVQRAMKTIEPLWMLKYLPNMIASHIAISIDAQGPNNSVIQGDASGLLALVEAADCIRRGWADVMVSGGTGSKINPTYLSYHGISNLAEPTDQPENACRPFDKNRTGTVVGEGAGVIVLERRSHAEARGAKIYAALSGFDYGYSAKDEATQVSLMNRRMERAIEKAGLAKEDVSHVNSYASGEIANDRIVAQSIHQTLNGVGVTAYKGNFGDMGPAGGTIETCAMLESLRTGFIPGSINYETPDESCPVNVLTENVEAKQTAAMKLSKSETGQQVALLFSAV